MKVNGKLDLKILGRIGACLLAALIIAAGLYGIFALINMLSWLIVCGIVAVILTPILYWLWKLMNDEIEIEIKGEDEDVDNSEESI